MPQCERHGHMNCRECFPQPSIPLDTRCAYMHPTIGRTCQERTGHRDLHQRHDSELGVVRWSTAPCGCTMTHYESGTVDQLTCEAHSKLNLRRVFPSE